MEVDEESDKKSDIKLHWMAAHARLKNAFTEDGQYHNLMRWLNLQTLPLVFRTIDTYPYLWYLRNKRMSSLSVIYISFSLLSLKRV